MFGDPCKGVMRIVIKREEPTFSRGTTENLPLREHRVVGKHVVSKTRRGMRVMERGTRVASEEH